MCYIQEWDVFLVKFELIFNNNLFLGAIVNTIEPSRDSSVNVVGAVAGSVVSIFIIILIIISVKLLCKKRKKRKKRVMVHGTSMIIMNNQDTENFIRLNVHQVPEQTSRNTSEVSSTMVFPTDYSYVQEPPPPYAEEQPPPYNYYLTHLTTRY